MANGAVGGGGGHQEIRTTECNYHIQHFHPLTMSFRTNCQCLIKGIAQPYPLKLGPSSSFFHPLVGCRQWGGSTTLESVGGGVGDLWDLITIRSFYIIMVNNVNYQFFLALFLVPLTGCRIIIHQWWETTPTTAISKQQRKKEKSVIVQKCWTDFLCAGEPTLLSAIIIIIIFLIKIMIMRRKF